jgi:hypothetical protein
VHRGTCPQSTCFYSSIDELQCSISPTQTPGAVLVSRTQIDFYRLLSPPTPYGLKSILINLRRLPLPWSSCRRRRIPHFLIVILVFVTRPSVLINMLHRRRGGISWLRQEPLMELFDGGEVVFDDLIAEGYDSAGNLLRPSVSLFTRAAHSVNQPRKRYHLPAQPRIRPP